jgi:hypothetical protein
MKHSEPYLEGLSRLAREAAEHLLKEKNLHDSMRVAAVCLYGSAAQFYFGHIDKYKDLDLQIFLRRMPGYRQSSFARLKRRGAPWKIGEYDGRKVEAFSDYYRQTLLLIL